MRASVIGFDLGDHFIKAVELARKGKKLYVSEVAHFPVPKGSIANGLLVNPEVFKRAISQILDAYVFQGKNIVIGVPGEQTIIKIIQVPANISKKKQIMFEFIRDDIQAELSTPVEKLYFDFQVLGTRMSEKGNVYDVIFAAVKKEHVDPYIEVFKSLGLNVIAADAELLAEARTLYLLTNEDDIDITYVLLNISSKTTTISFFEGGTLNYTRLIDMGASMFVRQVSEFKGISEREAEYLLNQRNILEEEENQQLRNIIAGAMKSLIREIHRVIAYYQSNISSSSGKFSGIISGGGALLKGFDTLLSEELGFPITKNRTLSYLEPLDVEKLHSDVLYEISPLVSTAFGLALWEYVDMLPGLAGGGDLR